MNNDNTTGATAKRLRVLIAEDSQRMRKSLSEMVSSVARLEVIGEAVDGFEAIDRVRNLKPDVLTLDINMPGMNGIDVLRAMEREKHTCTVIVLTALNDDFYRRKCQELHATYFFDKVTEFDRFVELLNRI